MTLPSRLAHVRWLAGGTGTGKSTVARLLAQRYGVAVYDGDRAEHDWLRRCDPGRHPRLAALGRPGAGGGSRGRTAEQVFRSMPGLYGETVGLLVEDLLDLPDDRIVVVDYFGLLPDHLAPLLPTPDHAAFLLPEPPFRRSVLTARYADPARARANWGDADPAAALALRLDRDALWDAEVRAGAERQGLPVLPVDGTVPPDVLAARVARAFGLAPRAHAPAGPTSP
ncbi:hypothetical protein [Streptomyces sp. NPDC058955]|uniref:hypothetical protein n=1 Tax=unclassified Streptomyces TaxID=2593676 RepID=UPI003665A3B2